VVASGLALAFLRKENGVSSKWEKVSGGEGEDNKLEVKRKPGSGGNCILFSLDNLGGGEILPPKSGNEHSRNDEKTARKKKDRNGAMGTVVIDSAG